MLALRLTTRCGAKMPNGWKRRCSRLMQRQSRCMMTTHSASCTLLRLPHVIAPKRVIEHLGTSLNQVALSSSTTLTRNNFLRHEHERDGWYSSHNMYILNHLKINTYYTILRLRQLRRVASCCYSFALATTWRMAKSSRISSLPPGIALALTSRYMFHGR